MIVTFNYLAAVFDRLLEFWPWDCVSLGAACDGVLIPVIGDPEGNMIELSPNIDHAALLRKSTSPTEHINTTVAQVLANLEQSMKGRNPKEIGSFLLFQMQQQQQQREIEYHGGNMDLKNTDQNSRGTVEIGVANEQLLLFFRPTALLCVLRALCSE